MRGIIPSHSFSTVQLGETRAGGASSHVLVSGRPGSDQNGPSFQSFETIENSPRAEPRENSPTAMHQAGPTGELSLITIQISAHIPFQVTWDESPHLIA